MPQISRLGHVGLFCNDLMKMRRFYSEVMGLTITDEDMERGLSSSALTLRPSTMSWPWHGLKTLRRKRPMCSRCPSR